MDENKRQQFLKTIAMIESSGGKNFDHDLITSGIHKGHRAAGTYGLMPNTIDEVINRRRLAGNVDPEDPLLKKFSPEDLKMYVENNPDTEQKLAESLADHVLDKQKGDEEKAAYSWFSGHNLTPERIDKRNYKDHDYVKKYNKFSKIKNALEPTE